MMDINQDAWTMLTDEERMALSLQYTLDKSSWESGEILNKSHYKYLEIKYRAEFLFKTFTEHLELFTTIIPEYVSGNKLVLGYFRLCIGKRLSPSSAIRELQKSQSKKILKKTLNQSISQTLKDWNKSDNLHNKAMFDLVKEFDRWNNFRILPKAEQEPSAFKRRLKNTHKKQLRVVKDLHPLAVDRLLEMYETKRSPCVYLPMISPRYGVFKIRENKSTMNIFNTLGIYVFKDIKIAERYLLETESYVRIQNKACKDGLVFWPVYRELIRKAYNYGEVMKIVPSRRHLQMAMQKFKLL